MYIQIFEALALVRFGRHLILAALFGVHHLDFCKEN